MERILLLSIFLCVWSFQAQENANCPIVDNVEQEFCESEGSGNDYYQPAVANLQATENGDEIKWYETATSTEALDPSELLEDGEDYFAGNASGTCTERQMVMVTLNDAPNAGGTTFYTVNATDAPFDLLDIYTHSSLGAPDAGGTVSPGLASGTTVFDPAVDKAGQYKYTVNSNSDCADDSSFCTITIEPGQSDPTADCPVVETANQEFCESEGISNDHYRPSVAHLEAIGEDVKWYETATSTEALDPSELLEDGEDYFAGNASGTCTERQMVMVTLNDSPNAGGTTFYTVNATDAPFDLLDIYTHSSLGAPDAGGTVSPALASGTTIFDPAVDKAGQYKYTVKSTTDCPDDSSYCSISINRVEDDDSNAAADASMDVTLYPNPTRGEVNLSALNGEKVLSVRIIDVKGNTVKQMQPNSGRELQTLDISSLQPSMYFAEIITERGKIVKRILKE